MIQGWNHKTQFYILDLLQANNLRFSLNEKLHSKLYFKMWVLKKKLLNRV